MVAVVGALTLLPLSLTHAQSPAALVAARGQVARDVAAWDRARNTQRETQTRYDALEHRIAQLKRLRAKDGFTAEGELDRLLKESVSADAALTASAQSVTSRASEVKKSVNAALAIIDARIRELLPSLKRGALEDRKAAARNINELRAARQELASLVGRLSSDSATPREWSKYDVQIEALDGPSELREKADVVEDTRERLRKKRVELATLVRDARIEQEVSRAAAEFRTDSSLFDEEARRGRGTATKRTNDELASAAVDGDGARGSSDPAAPEAGFNADDASPPPTAESGGTNPGTNLGTGQTPNVPSVGTTRSVPLTKQVDPNVLLNLRTDGLAGSNLDLATLEALVSDLDRLDQFLAGRAGQLRDRAKQLKDDEARALGKTK